MDTFIAVSKFQIRYFHGHLIPMPKNRVRNIFWSLSILGLIGGCENEREISTVQLRNNAEIAMFIEGMLSLQSDWNRTLMVSNGHDMVSKELLSDTGWWRGSNLYLHVSGVYVLDEGQAGCIAFRTDPPKFLHTTNEYCAKFPDRFVNTNTIEGDGRNLSRIYPRMYFIGKFSEFADAPRLRFIAVDNEAEAELPDPI